MDTRNCIWVLSLACSMCVLLSGCVGPAALKGGRSQYNKAVHDSENQELLLNLVRVRYREPVQFLQIGAINSRFDVSASAMFGGNFPESSVRNTYTPRVDLGYTESPTLTFNPVLGAEFAQQTQREMPLVDLVLLLRSGWNLMRVMPLVVDRIGENHNYAEQPSYENFIELVRLWNTLQDRGDMRFVYAPKGKTTIVAKAVPPEQVTVATIMQADKDGYRLQGQGDGSYQLVKPPGRTLALQLTYANEAEADRADHLLGIAPKRNQISGGQIIERLALVDPLEAATAPPPGQEVTPVPIWLRSFSNQLFYASRSVEIPAEHQKLVKSYTNIQGQPLDPRQALEGILEVRSSPDRPDDALVAVRYRGHWFYIADTDQVSKDTFHLLSVIFALQSEAPQGQPVLTLPVGG